MTANPRQGWQVRSQPDTELHRTPAGRFALPIVIERDGRALAEVNYVLTAAQIEELYENMRHLLTLHPTASQTTASRREELF